MATRKSFPADEDDYWTSSAASSKRVNVFAETVSFDDMKQMLKNQPLDNIEYEEDVINFDGTPAVGNSTSRAGSVDYQSARYRPPTSSSTVTSGSTSSQRIVSQHMTSSSSVGSRLCTDSSIDDVIGSMTPKRPPSVTETVKLETEIKFLKRSLETARNPEMAKVSPRDTVRKMILGLPYYLERYRSKEEKLLLLDEAIALHDGNCIIAAVLFLQNTIRPSIFNFELTRRPIATEHYINYLRQQFETEKLINLFGMLGRSEEAAMLKYKQAVAPQQAEIKLKNIQTCHRSHFQSEPSLAYESSLVSEHIQLLERQLPIEASDLQEIAKGSLIFKQIPRASTILNMPVITTLFYCCLYSYNLSENNLASPLAIRKAHKLTEKEYTWTVVRARSRLKRWQDLETLFQVKGWLGGTKLQAAIGFERLVPVMRRLEAPREIMNKYCSLIQPLETRLEIGQKFCCFESVIDTYMNLKDRQQLIAYQNKLKQNSQEWFYATDVLRTSTIKWKN